MSRSLSSLQAAALGIGVFAGLALGAFGLFSVSSRQWLWQDTFHLKVGFRQVQGVEPGTRVRILGTDAGEVEGVELPATPTGQVMLRLRLDGRRRYLVRADASAQILSEGMVGGKVVEINPGSDAAEPIQDNALIASVPAADWTTVLHQVEPVLQKTGQAVDQLDAALRKINSGEGSLGKLVKDDDVYLELVRSIRQIRGTMASLKQNADALKGMPVVRSYVQDPYKELIRPDCERQRRWFQEADLFEPGHAVLTEDGRQRLDDLAGWLNGLKLKGSEVVVASYAYPTLDTDFAHALTQKQSEAVCDYLTSHHSVHKMGWFSRRKVKPLGLGTDPAPVPVKELLPGVEVLVFVPQR